MASSASSQQLNKYRISRRGRKLQVFDDQKTLLALPKDVPERTWAEILQKEENDLIVFDIREEILEEAMRIGYEHYMERQTSLFTAHIAAQAWLKLIDWHFYRHDPGEDPSAFPPCHIPKRAESWIPDEMPEPSPKDSWSRHELDIVEDTPEEGLKKSPSISSLDLLLVEEIPSEFWFPGKVNLPEEYRRKGKKPEDIISYDVVESQEPSLQLAAESEVLQKITDYSCEELPVKESTLISLKTTTPVDGSLRGAGDSSVVRHKKRPTDKSKIFSKPSIAGRSRASLPPLDVGEPRSRVSIISDCRLRNLRWDEWRATTVRFARNFFPRTTILWNQLASSVFLDRYDLGTFKKLDTQYEIGSEKIDTPPGEAVKRK